MSVWDFSHSNEQVKESVTALYFNRGTYGYKAMMLDEDGARHAEFVEDICHKIQSWNK